MRVVCVLENVLYRQDLRVLFVKSLCTDGLGVERVGFVMMLNVINI